MAFIPPKGPALNQIIIRSAALLNAGDEAGAEQAKSTVHKDSGDLQSTIRTIAPELIGDYVQGGIRAGGVAPNGNTVNYAHEEEVRHPFLRTAISAIAERLHGGDRR